jgi:hypothetical protein
MTWNVSGWKHTLGSEIRLQCSSLRYTPPAQLDKPHDQRCLFGPNSELSLSKDCLANVLVEVLVSTSAWFPFLCSDLGTVDDLERTYALYEPNCRPFSLRWDKWIWQRTSILGYLKPILLMTRKDPLLQLLFLAIEAVFDLAALLT